MNNLDSGLIFKWLKSENTSSKESRKIANKIRQYLGMSHKEYRKMLSWGRQKTKVLERLMSDRAWDKIDFSKLPSKAGLIYRNAFARHDIMREKENKMTYADFAKSKETKVNAKTLNPCEVIHEAISCRYEKIEDTNRLMVNKYWDNLKNYFHNAKFNGVAVVDTSASMRHGGYCNAIQPIDVAISLGMYCAEKCHPDSPWAGHYITFSRDARLVPVEGVDIVDKAFRIYDTNLCQNTNIKSVFDLLLNLAIRNRVKPEDMPENIVIISDMEFDSCSMSFRRHEVASEMEKIAEHWAMFGYQLPKLVFWNVDARQDNIPMRDNGRVTFVSGYSAVTYEMLMTGKTGLDLVLDKLNDKRYSLIQ